MPNKDEAEKAISGLNGKDLKGRTLSVNEARPRSCPLDFEFLTPIRDRNIFIL
jgi:RNA recognition motif-containing protein